jgi:myo-inositol 2-dehydrogenase/D-chiro-inositol 1-dehydrogenase
VSSTGAHRLHVGVAGIGEIGVMHAQIVDRAPGCDLRALGSGRADRAGELTAALGRDVAVLGYEKLFAHPDIDAVLVTSRTPDHPRHAAAALDAGKHVLVEKPAATTTEGWQTIRRAHARRPDLVLQVGYMRHFDPAFAELRTRIEQGDLGLPTTLQLSSREHYPPGADEGDSAKGGLLVDIGVHDFDAACWLLGEAPSRCYATGASRRYPELAAMGDVDTALVTLEFPSGAVAYVHVSRAGALGLQVACDVHAVEGSLHLRPLPLGGGVTAIDRAAAEAAVPSDYRERFADAFSAQLAAFVAAAGGGSRALPGLDDDMRAVGIAGAAARSLRSGRAEPVADKVDES